jgi:hypothetical protein
MICITSPRLGKRGAAAAQLLPQPIIRMRDVMTKTGFPTHEDRSLPRWISASVAVGAVMFAMIGMLSVASGTAGSSERAAASSSIDHAKAMTRSGTLMAQRIVY